MPKNPPIAPQRVNEICAMAMRYLRPGEQIRALVDVTSVMRLTEATLVTDQRVVAVRDAAHLDNDFVLSVEALEIRELVIKKGLLPKLEFRTDRGTVKFGSFNITSRDDVTEQQNFVRFHVNQLVRRSMELAGFGPGPGGHVGPGPGGVAASRPGKPHAGGQEWQPTGMQEWPQAVGQVPGEPDELEQPGFGEHEWPQDDEQGWPEHDTDEAPTLAPSPAEADSTEAELAPEPQEVEPQAAVPIDLVSELERLFELNWNGALTDEEYAAAKASLIARHQSGG